MPCYQSWDLCLEIDKRNFFKQKGNYFKRRKVLEHQKGRTKNNSAYNTILFLILDDWNKTCNITWSSSSWNLENSCKHFKNNSVQSIQSLSHIRLFATPWIAARQASLSITNSRSLLKLMSIESLIPSSNLILCRPLLLLPPIPPSIRVFSIKSTLCVRWPKYRSFSFSLSPSNEHPGLISFRMDWLDLLAVQGTLKSLLQHHS